jgi:hypothetical protein
VVTHPVLGGYLSCERCARKLERELLPVEVERDADGVNLTLTVEALS